MTPALVWAPKGGDQQEAGADRPISDTEATLRAVLESTADGFYALDPDWRVVVFNPAAEAYFGRPRSEVLGQVLWEVFPRALGSPFERLFREVAVSEEAVKAEMPSAAKPGRVVEMRVAPMRGGGIAVSFTDITERRRLEEDLRAAEARLGAQLNELEAIYAASPVGLAFLDARLRFVRVNDRMAAINGLPVHEHLGRDLTEVLPRLASETRTIARQVLERGEAVLNQEIPIAAADGHGHPRCSLQHWVPLRDEAGIVVGINIVAEEITERKAAERQRALLVAELNHRVKNTLAVVQSIARQTMRDAVHADVVEAFEGRLAALSQAHALLTREFWASATVADVANEALRAHALDGDRFWVAGPEVRLPPKTAVMMALAFHELCTNARKYGSLSRPDGQVRLTWRLQEGPLPRVHLRWQEVGGPVVAAPVRRGFGMRMLQSVLAVELEGEVRLSFAPDGLVCDMEAPLPASPAP